MGGGGGGGGGGEEGRGGEGERRGRGEEGKEKGVSWFAKRHQCSAHACRSAGNFRLIMSHYRVNDLRFLNGMSRRKR